jgi:trehalose/maltose hydrolase-like predicted phosphorylase
VTPTERDLPAALDRRFEAALFDWDGTAVPDRSAPAERVRAVVEALSRAAFDVLVVTGTNIDNVDGQLRARPEGPGELLLCLNRGSEVFRVGPDGPELVERREATPAEDEALTRAAERVVARLAERGLQAEIVAQRLNRRKVDLIPEPEWADPPKARISELLEAVRERLRAAGISDVSEVVDLALEASREAGLVDAKVTSDAKHVEIGLTDKADSAQWAFDHLWQRGIAPGAVLVGGDEFGPLGGVAGSDSLLLAPPAAAAATAVTVGAEPLGVPDGILFLEGGPAAFVELLEDQLARRERGEPPGFDAPATWALDVEGLDPDHEEACESTLTLADGRIGTRGSSVAPHARSAPVVRAGGVYGGERSDSMLVECPLWNRLGLAFEDGDHLRRALDLRTGVLHQWLERPDDGRLRAALFSSRARPGTSLLRADAPHAWLAGSEPLVHADRGRELARGWQEGTVWAEVAADGTGVTAGARDLVRELGPGEARLDRVAAYVVGAPAPAHRSETLVRVEEAASAGFDRLLAEHRAAWAQAWEDSDVLLEGDDRLQRDIRFALFHLHATVPDVGPAPVGARGLSGEAYHGHVFWDTDIFVLPFLAATRPDAARAVLEYRVATLPAAMAAARASGAEGARFAWESAGDGHDVTPTFVRRPDGTVIPIRTGIAELHVVADVAWAVAHYLDWTGDEDFRRGDGSLLMTETARYWASRIRVDRDGRAHLYGVIGPDEYHEPVDDNAFTNVMARWNLRRGAAEADGVTDEERTRWLDLADRLVDGYDSDTGIYEQFAGFRGLDPLVISELAERPVTADQLLGRPRVQSAQIVKQADVLMLHHLLPDEVEPGSLTPNLEFYEPRTAHGSSLSPGIHASLLARAGRHEDALHWLSIASRLDVDDLTRTTASGLHMATLGSVWQALAFGFAGVRPAGDALAIDPRLPAAWSALELRLRFRGTRLRVRFEHDAVTLTADEPVRVLVRDRPVEATPAGTTIPALVV